LVRGADLVLGASTDLVDRAKDLGADDARFLPAAAPQVEPVSAEAAAAARSRLAAEYGFDEGAVIVLAVGRVARQKNYPMLVRGADLVLGASTDLVDRAKDLGADDARFLPAAAPQVEPVSAEAAAAARSRLAAEYGFDEGAVIVLAVGRVARQKNYPMLVR